MARHRGPRAVPLQPALRRPLREHGLLQAITRVNRKFSHEKDGTPTEKGHGLVVDYCGISHDPEQALASFEWADVVVSSLCRATFAANSGDLAETDAAV